MTSLELTLGWIWETCVADLFYLTGASTRIKVDVKVVLYILLAMGFAVVLVAVHLYVRDWVTGEYDDSNGLFFDRDSNNNDTNDSNNNNNHIVTTELTITSSNNVITEL